MAYTPTNWQNLPNTTTPITANALNNMETGIKKSDTVIGGDEYDSTATYEIGDFCIYNNKLYRCTTAISTAEAFTPAHWEETSVEEELDALRKKVENFTYETTAVQGDTIQIPSEIFAKKFILIECMIYGRGHSQLFTRQTITDGRLVSGIVFPNSAPDSTDVIIGINATGVISLIHGNATVANRFRISGFLD